MGLPHSVCAKGDTVFIRATVIEACSDAFKVRIEDYPNLIITTWVPAGEVSRAVDIGNMRPMQIGGCASRDLGNATAEACMLHISAALVR